MTQKKIAEITSRIIIIAEKKQFPKKKKKIEI